MARKGERRERRPSGDGDDSPQLSDDHHLARKGERLEERSGLPLAWLARFPSTLLSVARGVPREVPPRVKLWGVPAIDREPEIEWVDPSAGSINATNAPIALTWRYGGRCEEPSQHDETTLRVGADGSVEGEGVGEGVGGARACGSLVAGGEGRGTSAG